MFKVSVKRGIGIVNVFFFVLFAVVMLPGAHALTYIAKLQVSLEKSFYGPNEEMHVSGSLLVSNTSSNDTSFNPIVNATINFSILNSSGIQAQYLLNTSSSGIFRSNSELFSGVQINSSTADGYYNFTASYRDYDNVEWKSGGKIRVFGQSIDLISISPSKARYSASENVSVKLKALREVGNKKVALSNVSVNGSLRYTNRTTIASFSCTTDAEGSCSVSLTAPQTAATYILEVNNFLSTSSFKVIPFEVFLYIKDSTGENFKEIFNANEVGTIEVRVTENGSSATGSYVFNGTITNSNSAVITRINSTNLNSNNSYTNRFSFTVANSFTNGIYFADVTAYKTEGGSGSAAATTSFEVRSWSLSFNKASENSGFEYEYAAFPNRNISFEIFPKERENGTIIQNLNNTQFNITIKAKTGEIISSGNATWNGSCSGSGCYTFKLTTPVATGSYILSVSLNHSNEVQTAKRIVSVTSTSLTATPTNQEGELKEQFGTTEFMYITLSAQNTSSAMNVSNVVLESVFYENGTRFNFTEVSTWGEINSSNSALEWSFNSTVQRIKFDAPKSGGNYLVNLFVNNRTAAASTKFTINPYSVCSAAKSTAGSVDSSSSFYVWQYKATDTIYLELKVTQAQNSVGKATAANGTKFSSTYYGMGNACFIDTTKTQVITNATITVQNAINLQTNAKASINTTASTCSADDNQGTYTCTIKPSASWDGGRYIVNLKILGQDGETSSTSVGMFEARAFYIWAYSSSWTNKPASNITFNVRMYEAGTNWWSNYGAQGGITGDITIEKVEYNGKDGEWLWPPIDIKYNTTGLNSSNVTAGSGTLTLETSRLPKGRWEAGYYVLTIKGTNDATGESDYGQAWFGIRKYDAYSTPVELSGTSYVYKNSFGTKENVTLFIRVTNAGEYNDNGGTSLGGNITIGVKKLQYYTSWPPTEMNSSAYSVRSINVNLSSPWYWNANSNSHSGYIMTISPTSGTWNGGYYNVILDINGSETGYGWFNAIAFYVNTQPTNASGSYSYTNKGNMPVYFNVTTTKNQKMGYGNYGTADYINTTFKDIVLRTWLEGSWQSVEYNYPENLNVSPLQVNGSTLIMVNKSGSWPSGYYWGEITLLDSENSTGTGYLWFSVRPFRVETSTNQYTIDTDSNISIILNVRQPDWSNNNLIPGNYSIVDAYEDIWSAGGRSKTTYTNYVPSANQTFNATTVLNISPSITWSTANGGYHYLNIVVRDNNDNSTQTGWVSFRTVPFSVSIGSIDNRYSIPQSSNVTFPVTVTRAVSGANSTANVSRAYEWVWPTQTEYNFSVGSCSSSSGTICQINGTQNITLIAPSGGWPSGWHYIDIDFMSADGSNKIKADGSAWFNAVQAYDGYFSTYDANGNWKYYFDFADNITITIYVRNSNYIPQVVNITKVEMSEDGDSCWSESCKSYTNYSYTILNGSGGTGIAGNGTIKIANNGTRWKRGQHSIKATISGSSGTAVIKTGYIWVKDNSVPNITIAAPLTGATITQSSFLISATSSENALCSLHMFNYDQFHNNNCGSTNTSNDASCNNTRFNGSTSYSRYISYPPYGGMTTGGTSHSYTFSTSGLAIQDYGLKLACYDVDWNYAAAQTAFKINFSGTGITINLSSPANNATLRTTTATFNYNITGTPNGHVNCLTYVNLSSGWNGYVPTGTDLNSTGAAAGNTTLLDYFTNGTYKWTIYCADSQNTAWAAENRTFTVDNTSTASSGFIITLLGPANGATIASNNSTVAFNYDASGSGNLFNCTLWGNFTGAWAANLTNNSVSGQATTSAINLSDNTYLWNVRCVNSSNSGIYNWSNSGNWTFTVGNGSTNTNGIIVTLTAPADSASFTTANSSINITFGVNASATATNGTCDLYTNYTGNWTSNKSATLQAAGSQGNNLSINITMNWTLKWNVLCGNSTLSNFSSSNRTFSVIVNNGSSSGSGSSNGFTIILSSPTNGSTISSNSTVAFIYNASDSAGSLFNCTLWGNFTGAWAANLTNNSVSGQATTSAINLSASDYLWNVRCVNSTSFNSELYNWSNSGNWTFRRG